MNKELIERLKITEQMLNVAHFEEAESLIREARDAIEELQSKLTASRRLKKGKWFNYQGNTKIVLCSECRMPALESMTGCLPNQHLAPNRTNFCPNCGADMREEKTDDQNTQ